jgi:hypothetical protein
MVAAMPTKMSLKPVMLLVRGRQLPFAGDEVAEGRGLVGGQHATGDGGLKVAFAVHRSRLPRGHSDTGVLVLQYTCVRALRLRRSYSNA